MQRQTLILASPDADQTQAIRHALEGDYVVDAVPALDDCRTRLPGAALLLLDHAAFDSLATITPQCAAPILTLVPPGDLTRAVDSLLCGAFTFVIKTDGYESLLLPVVRDTLWKMAERTEMRRTIAELEQRLGGLLREQAQATTERSEPAQRRRVVDEIAARLRAGEVNFPAYPEIGSRLRALIDKGAGIGEASALLSTDAGIAATLMHVANSSYYGGSRATETVEQAITRLGMVTTLTQVEIIANRALYEGASPHHRSHLLALWRHGVACGFAAQLTARAVGADDGRAFTLGLLHDIGRLFLISVLDQLEARKVLDASADRSAIHDLLDAHHAEFGNALLRRWRLPESLCVAVAQHEHPGPTAAAAHPDVAMLRLADRLCERAGFGSGRARPRPDAPDREVVELARVLGLDERAVADIVGRVTSAVRATCGDESSPPGGESPHT